MFSTFDVSTSALVAQRVQLNAISSNLANMSTTRNEAGEITPYQPRYVVFQTDDDVQTAGGGSGVKVSSVEIADVPSLMKYQPWHPDAIQSGPLKGYVEYPNVDPATEMINAMLASRAYEANVSAMEVTKGMISSSLRLLA